MRKYIIILCVASLRLFTSCIGDLDTHPLNSNDFTDGNVYSTPESYLQGLAKLYGGFVLVGPNEGQSDIAVSDAGASELNRAFWTLQEMSTDAGKCAWINDPWVSEVNTNTWSSAKNDAVFAVYNRIMLLVTQVSEYLRQTTDSKLSSRGVGLSSSLYTEIQNYRREARFIRAYAYWQGLDVFRKMPFVDESSAIGIAPPQFNGTQLFNYIEEELIALTTDGYMMNIGVYPRVDKSAVWALLARLYLNAEVYMGVAHWSEAVTATQQINAVYELATEYDILFMGDNGENVNARKEFIYAVVYDAQTTRSYGGTTYLTIASVQGADQELIVGTEGGWGGIRSTYEYARDIFGVTAPNYVTGDYTCDDKRAMFFIKGRSEEMNQVGNFSQGWSVTKWKNVTSTGANNSAGPFSSTDYPMIRLAEVYLIYAEATLRVAGTASSSDATALTYLNDLRTRAGITTALTTYTLDDILDERGRELFWEGHRRTDLNRFGRYTGAFYLWKWKGDSDTGIAIDEKYKVFPIIIEDLIANPNLTQNSGY